MLSRGREYVGQIRLFVANVMSDYILRSPYEPTCVSCSRGTIRVTGGGKPGVWVYGYPRSHSVVCVLFVVTIEF